MLQVHTNEEWPAKLQSDVASKVKVQVAIRPASDIATEWGHRVLTKLSESDFSMLGRMAWQKYLCPGIWCFLVVAVWLTVGVGCWNQS